MPTDRGAAAPAASVRGAAVRYAGGVEALAGVDLDLARGEIAALVGANGSGKTTLVRLLAGVLAPTAGRVEVLGVAAPAAASPKARRDLRRRIGYVPQGLALDPEMTGGEILALLAALHGVRRGERRRRTAALADAFGAASHLGRRVDAWSGGLRRRLHLAAGLIHDPELLLLDEPTAGLDVDGCDALWAELERRARGGVAVAVVTHDLAAVERHAARVAILDAGRRVAFGPPRGLIAAHGGGSSGPGEAASPSFQTAGLAAAFRRLTGRDPSALAPRPAGEGAP